MVDRADVPPGCHLIAKDSVGSTSEDARFLAAEGAPHLTVVWAREQTAGRGRHGRSWASPRGNLYLSILLRPDCSIADAPQIGFAVGAAMARAIREISGAEVDLKWPNDLLLDGHKVSGILLESAGRADGALDWVIAGIGVNVGSRPDVPGSTSLCAAGYDVAVEALLESFLPKLVELLAIWSRDGFAPVRAVWSALALSPDTAISVKLPDGIRTGIFMGIDESGNLVLRDGSGVEHIAVGDVFPLSTVFRKDVPGAS
ncbi:MAG: biotin--[acetyl-CoA-carboxylase] ligase [Alphaproteobacteria bacterium]|nr:biotin--[acetyl-CoA-carboxylase] ligase [Alphaproteobacteria bacterium]HCP01460.1 biotin--[acetyl-CoA-carboxylase] ligase [Rhodospirillaceae bacterium]